MCVKTKPCKYVCLCANPHTPCIRRSLALLMLSRCRRRRLCGPKRFSDRVSSCRLAKNIYKYIYIYISILYLCIYNIFHDFNLHAMGKYIHASNLRRQASNPGVILLFLRHRWVESIRRIVLYV